MGRPLTVTGFTISVDATALTSPSFGVNGVLSGPTSVITNFVLVPGLYTFISGFQVQFEVLGDGTIDYETFLDDVLLGRGTNTLVVLGDPGDPPTILERIASLRDATDRLDSPMEPGLLTVLDRLADAVVAGNTSQALALVNAFIRIVEGGLTARAIDPIAGQLLIARAQQIQQALP